MYDAPDLVRRRPHVYGGEKSASEQLQELVPLDGRVEQQQRRLVDDQVAGVEVARRHETLALKTNMHQAPFHESCENNTFPGRDTIV